MALGDFTPRQQAFTEVARSSPEITDRFYFGGGTCLSAYYLHHRVSEDLDFFSEQEVDSEAVRVWLQGKKAVIGFGTVDFHQAFNRNLFFLQFSDGETLKTEFTFYPFPRIDATQTKNGLPIDSLKDIAVNKLFTIYQKQRGRDYYDLYSIMNETHWELAELSKLARIKFDTHIDPLQLATRFDGVVDTLDDPILSGTTYDPQKVEKFFLSLATTLRPEILQ